MNKTLHPTPHTPETNILVRLPNWLGDVVMAMPFITALQQQYPQASISLIIKKGLEPLLTHLPQIQHLFIFSKAQYPGAKGAYRFGKAIRQQQPFHLFFCLPDSFSAAIMGWATGAAKTIGYRKAFRSFLFTHTYQKNQQTHRVQQYIGLIENYAKHPLKPTPFLFPSIQSTPKNQIIFNINSEAVSRRLPPPKAIGMLQALLQHTTQDIVMIGGPNDAAFVQLVIKNIDNPRVINKTGTTTLPSLISLMAGSQLVLTTDSGPAHLACATGVPTVVLFGAGNEQNTAPYNPAANLTIIRLGKLPCEPCVSNTCKPYTTPQCLALLDEQQVLQAIKLHLPATQNN